MTRARRAHYFGAWRGVLCAAFADDRGGDRGGNRAVSGRGSLVGGVVGRVRERERERERESKKIVKSRRTGHYQTCVMCMPQSDGSVISVDLEGNHRLKSMTTLDPSA